MPSRSRSIAATAIWLAAAAVAVAFGYQRFSAAASDTQPDLEGFFLPAARAILAGDSPYTVAGYFYSPLVALALAPFADQVWVTEYWTALRVACGIAACVLTALAFTPRGAWCRSGLVAVLALVTLLWSWPATLDLWAGQIELIVLLALGCAVFAKSRGSRFLAGFALGMAGALKTWPALFVLWLARAGARRRSREWLGVAAAAALAATLAFATGGIPGILDMAASPLRGGDQPLLAANSAWGISRILFTETPMAQPLTVSPQLQVTLAIALALWATTLAVVILVRPGAPGISLFNVAFVVILMLPVSHYFYVIYALPTLWWWGARAIDRPTRVVPWVVFAAMLVWWMVVFRIAPAGDGFMTTTWQSLLRIFAACLVAATISVVAAATSRIPQSIDNVQDSLSSAPRP